MSRTHVAAAMVAGISVAVAITAVVLVTVQDGQGQRCADVAATPADVKTLQAVQAPLTKDEIEEALRIASADNVASRIRAIGGNTDHVQGVGLVTDAKSTVRIGAVVMYVLKAPIDIDLTLPSMDFDACDDASLRRGYGLLQRRTKVQGLTRFAVYVDLNSRDVVGIVPRDYASLDGRR